MRVLFLADAVFVDLPGGSRVVARELALRLTQRGHDVTFLVARQTPDAPADERTPWGRVVRYDGAGEGPRFVLASRAACARLWAEGAFDLVHTHFAYAALGPLRIVPRAVPHVRSFYGPWDQEGWTEDCARLAQRAGGPRRALGLVFNRVRRVLRRRVEAVNLRRSQAVIVLSEQSRGEVAEFAYPPDRVHLVPGGTDLVRFHPAKDRQAVRQALGLPDGRRLLLSVRRLAARMGLDILIEAMPAVVARHPDVLLLIGGKGPERERLERLIRERQLESHVRLLGFIPDEQLAAHYQAASAFVLPTLALEGFGLVTVEALACGTPVIGTPVGATPEILGGLDARLIARAATSDALAACLLDFLGGEWAADLSAERLHRFVAERYSWDRHVDAVAALYAAQTPASRTPRHELM